MARSQARYPPGTEQPRRFRPALRYELIGCGLHGHELLGTDVAEIRPEDALVVRQDDQGLRWYRCLRCDSWLPLPPPPAKRVKRHHLPARAEISLPLRGRPLRDKYVLRLIALDRFLHFLGLGLLAAGVLLVAANKATISRYWFVVLQELQRGVTSPTVDTTSGIAGRLTTLLSSGSHSLLLTGAVLIAYAVLEGTEAVGLWLGKRWAEYLTLVATSALLIPEIVELTKSVSPLKLVALIINLAVVAYLLVAKRLFGFRGGGRAEQREREHDSGWEALERTLPQLPGSAYPGLAPTGSGGKLVQRPGSVVTVGSGEQVQEGNGVKRLGA